MRASVAALAASAGRVAIARTRRPVKAAIEIVRAAAAFPSCTKHSRGRNAATGVGVTSGKGAVRCDGLANVAPSVESLRFIGAWAAAAVDTRWCCLVITRSCALSPSPPAAQTDTAAARVKELLSTKPEAIGVRLGVKQREWLAPP